MIDELKSGELSCIYNKYFIIVVVIIHDSASKRETFWVFYILFMLLYIITIFRYVFRNGILTWFLKNSI